MRPKVLLPSTTLVFQLQNYFLEQDKPNIKLGKIAPDDLNLQDSALIQMLMPF